MFMVKTADGLDKYLVQLVGPRSYRMGNSMTHRGQTLTVSQRTREYLVRRTNGAWVDFDPTPPEPIEELMPPQFGDYNGPSIDMADIDPIKNPALSMEHAVKLAAHGAEVTNPYQARSGGAYDGVPMGIDPDDLDQAAAGAVDAPDGSGDLSGADLKSSLATAGGKSAVNPVKGGLKMTTKAVPVAAVPKAGAVTVD